MNRSYRWSLMLLALGSSLAVAHPGGGMGMGGNMGVGGNFGGAMGEAMGHGNAMGNLNAAMPAQPPAAPGMTATPAMPGNPKASAEVTEHRQTGSDASDTDAAFDMSLPDADSSQ